MKIADIDTGKLSEGLGLWSTLRFGRCRTGATGTLQPKNLQGTRPLTLYRALPEPILAGRQEKGAVAPFLLEQDNP